MAAGFQGKQKHRSKRRSYRQRRRMRHEKKRAAS